MEIVGLILRGFSYSGYTLYSTRTNKLYLKGKMQMLFNEKQFRQLADETIKTVVALGTTSEEVLKRHRKSTERLIGYLKALDTPFNRDLCLDWVDSMKPDQAMPINSKYVDWIAFRRFVMLLAEQKAGTLNYWTHYRSRKLEMPATEEFMSVVPQFRVYCSDAGLHEKTVRKYSACVRRFLIFLEEKGVVKLSDIQNPHIAGYFASTRFESKSPKSIQSEASEMKKFIEFLRSKGYTTSETLQYAIPRYRVPMRKIVTILTTEMVSDIFEDEPNSTVDKRDKAMGLLALHIGLRTGDIRNLKFSDIDWERKTLKIKQSKTGVCLEMPIDNETENAIIDYVLNERRERNVEYIFITAVGPAQKIANHNYRVKYRAKGTPSFDKIPQDGLHIFRRTFASRLLQCGVEVSMISDMLGHVNKNTAQKYLSTDEIKMKRCALNLSMIPYQRGDF